MTSDKPQAANGEKGKGSLEGLRVNVMTVVAAGIVLISTSITIGLYMSKLTTLEGRVELAERTKGEASATLSKLNQDLAILETRVRRAEDTQQEGAKKLDRIATNVEAIGEMVLIMCQTSARPGVTCRLMRP